MRRRSGAGKKLRNSLKGRGGFNGLSSISFSPYCFDDYRCRTSRHSANHSRCGSGELSYPVALVGPSPVLLAGELPADPQALIVEIPLTQSQSVLTKRVADIMREEFAKKPSQTKSRRESTAQFGLTKGAEPKLDAVREMLTVYRDVYLKHPKARGKALLHEMRTLYLNRKQKRFAKIPEQLDDTKGKLEDRMRNLRRYITKAERVMLNVANGQFPGKY